MTDNRYYRTLQCNVKCPYTKTTLVDADGNRVNPITTSALQWTSLSTSHLISADDLHVLGKENILGTIDVYVMNTSTSYAGYQKVFISKVNNVLTYINLQGQQSFTGLTVTANPDNSLLITIPFTAAMFWSFTGTYFS